MANLPNEPGELMWQITDIGDLVYLIENPGLGNEKVHFKWNLTHSMGVSQAIQEVETECKELLTPAQLTMTTFWLGYFYAHFSRR